MKIYVLYRIVKYDGGHGEGLHECAVRFHEVIFKNKKEAEKYIKEQTEWLKYTIQEFIL